MKEKVGFPCHCGGNISFTTEDEVVYTYFCSKCGTSFESTEKPFCNICFSVNFVGLMAICSNPYCSGYHVLFANSNHGVLFYHKITCCEFWIYLDGSVESIQLPAHVEFADTLVFVKAIIYNIQKKYERYINS